MIKAHDPDGIGMVSAWVSDNRLTLGQTQVDTKSNEITAIPHLLAALDITGCVVTIDAIGTQTAIAQQIVQAQADYLLPAKDNQGTLYDDIQMLFDGFEQETMSMSRMRPSSKSLTAMIGAKFASVGW